MLPETFSFQILQSNVRRSRTHGLHRNDHSVTASLSLLQTNLDHTSSVRCNDPSSLYINNTKTIWSTMYFQANWSKLKSASTPTSFSKGGGQVMIIQDPQYKLSVRSVEARVSNPGYRLPTLSDGWTKLWESRRSRFMRKDVRSVDMSFWYLGNGCI